MENKSKKNNILILVALIGVLIVVCAYFFVYQKFNEMAEQVEAENATLGAEVSRLQALDAKKPEYIAETERMNEYIQEFETHYPSGILPEDSIMMVKNMEDRNRTFVANISFSNPEEVVYASQPDPAAGTSSVDAATAPAQADQAAADADAALAGSSAQSGASSQSGIVTGDVPTYAATRMYEVPLSLSIECTYDDFKGLIDYIYAQNDRMSVRGVNISYNTETNGLSGNMTLSTYCLSGTQKLYTPPNIPNMGMGVDTIFGNID